MPSLACVSDRCDTATLQRARSSLPRLSERRLLASIAASSRSRSTRSSGSTESMTECSMIHVEQERAREASHRSDP